MHYATHGRDGRAPHRSRLAASAGTPVGAAQVPKRLRYLMQRDGVVPSMVLHMVLRIVLRVIAQRRHAHSPGAANVDRAALHTGAVAFIHRFSSDIT